MNYIVCPPLYEGTSFNDLQQCVINALRENNIDVVMIGTPILRNTLVEHLDDPRYLPNQLLTLSLLENVENGSKVLFLDFFFPGLDIIMYHFKLRNIFVKTGALLHGSSYIEDDLYTWNWLKPYETAWWNTYDRVYASKAFPIHQLPSDFKTKLVLMDWGMDGKNFPIPKDDKDYEVVFPHRLNDDKGISDLIILIGRLSHVQFLITCPQDLGDLAHNPYYPSLSAFNNVSFKSDYSDAAHLDTLSRSKIVLSCARQENFGYSILKAVRCGAIPVLPNRLCYPNMYNKIYLYDNIDGAATLIRSVLDGSLALPEILNSHNYSFTNILTDFFKTE